VLTLHRCLGVDRPMARRRLVEVEVGFTSDDSSWPFAFVAICHALGLDPDYLRCGLRACRPALNRVAGRKAPLRRNAGVTQHRVVARRRSGGSRPLPRARWLSRRQRVQRAPEADLIRIDSDGSLREQMDLTMISLHLHTSKADYPTRHLNGAPSDVWRNGGDPWRPMWC
jgi:hypothetical protein